MMTWQDNILTTAAQVRELLAQVKTVAVLGMKTEAQLGQPAFYVPQSLASFGLHIIPVPVYYPEATHILGRKVYRKLIDIPEDVGVVDVFRRPQNIPQHVEDILAKQPSAVWLQSSIRNDEVADRLVRAGLKVVQDRCLMVEYRSLR